MALEASLVDLNRIAILTKQTSFNELGTRGLLGPVTLAWQR